MRLTQFFFIAAATTGVVHAQTTTTPASSATTDLKLTMEDVENLLDYNPDLGKQVMNFASMANSFNSAYSTYTGVSSLEADFSAWASTQTAASGPTIPTQLPEDIEEMLRQLGEVDLMDDFLKDSGKDYLPKEVQSSYLHDVNAMATVGKELASLMASQTAFSEILPQSTGEAEEKDEDKDNAAGRVGGVGALGIALVAGIVVVAAL